MTRKYDEEQSKLEGAHVGIDVTPSATDFTEHTRGIMVTEDDITVTGLLIGSDTPHTTAPLKVGIMYPFYFKRITAVSGGAVKAYY